MNEVTPKDNNPAWPVSPSAESQAPLGNTQQPVRAARFRRRHFGLVLSWFMIVLLPFTIVAFYMLSIADDQYSSVTGFTVRQEEGGGASELLGGLATLTGASSSSDGDIL